MVVGSTNSPGANLNITGYGDGLEGVEGTTAGVQEVEQRRSSCEGVRNNTSRSLLTSGREDLSLEAAASPRTPIAKSQNVEGSGAVAISPKSLQSWLLP